MSYVLRTSKHASLCDVRFVNAYNDTTLLISSRDNTASQWSLENKTLHQSKTMCGHQGFVNFVVLHPHLQLVQNEPCFITGSNDNHVIVWNAESCMIEAVLDGHSRGVSCGALAQTNTGLDIVTGDWNGMCIVFDCHSGKPKQTYSKHGIAIRAIAQLPSSPLIVSASADKSAHVWDVNTGDTIQICNYHNDVVQCMCAIDTTTFCTGSNDCTIAIWRVGREVPVTVLQGHQSLVYGLTWNLSTSELLSCSEDRTVIVWGNPAGIEKFEAKQVVNHPTLVWSVAALPNGDILTGTSDGYIRVFTRAEERFASADLIVEFNEAVSSQRIDARTTAPELIAGNLPSTDQMSAYAGKEGDRKMFKNNNGEVELYIFSGGMWDKVGVVVSGPEQTPVTGSQPQEKKAFNGKEYDYLFDVEIGGKMLKLPYNSGETVSSAVWNFINSHPALLSVDNFEAIRDFIVTNISPADRSLLTASREAIVEIQECSSFEEVSMFNADGVKKKVTEILGESGMHFHPVIEKATSGTASAAELTAFLSAMPDGSRFPAIDTMRVGMRKAINPSEIVRIGKAVVSCFTKQLPVNAIEWTVCIRFAASLFEIALKTASLWVESSFLADIAAFIAGDMVALSFPSSALIEKGVSLLVKNASFFVVASLNTPVVSDSRLLPQMDHIALLLLTMCANALRHFKSSEVCSSVLSALLTLYDPKLNSPLRHLSTANAAGRTVLLSELQAIALNSDSSEARRVSVVLLPLL